MLQHIVKSAARLQGHTSSLATTAQRVGRVMVAPPALLRKQMYSQALQSFADLSGDDAASVGEGQVSPHAPTASLISFSGICCGRGAVAPYKAVQ